MRKLCSFACVLVIVAAPGCFYSRSKVEAPLDPETLALIQVGESTKEDVARILGAPTDIIFSNREHDPYTTFAYEYTRTLTKTTGLTFILVTFLNSDTKRDHVLVFFDDLGVVSAVGVRLDADKASYGLPFGE